MAQSDNSAQSAFQVYAENLKKTPARFRDALFRHDKPDTDRARSQAVFANFFLHLHSTRVHERTLRFWATCGLGVAALASFMLLTVTGILLMIYYKPTTALAYQSIKDIHFIVPTGAFIRNIHRWSAHLMVLSVAFHMARVFYRGAYKPPRQFNWVIGVVLLVLTLLMSFTGYLLPWDQLAFWAVTVGTEMASYVPFIGDSVREMLLGGPVVGASTLLRFYVLHVAVLPSVIVLVLMVHLWRWRKDAMLDLDRSETDD